MRWMWQEKEVNDLVLYDMGLGDGNRPPPPQAAHNLPWGARLRRSTGSSLTTAPTTQMVGDVPRMCAFNMPTGLDYAKWYECTS